MVHQLYVQIVNYGDNKIAAIILIPIYSASLMGYPSHQMPSTYGGFIHQHLNMSPLMLAACASVFCVPAVITVVGCYQPAARILFAQHTHTSTTHL